jgi:putative membrane protein
MKFKAIILLSGTLALVACGRNGEATNADANVAAGNEVAANEAQAALPLTSQGFANAAAASDRFEIESSRLAATAGQSAAIKDFAAQMVTAHTESSAKLKAAAAALSPPLTPDDTLPPPLQQKLDSLRALNGAQFDSAYAAAQVEAHQKALDMLNGYAASGDNPALKELASGLVPKVSAHLNMAKGLK